MGIRNLGVLKPWDAPSDEVEADLVVYFPAFTLFPSENLYPSEA